jgi:transcriptional regulator with XRE-family HTH domain
VQNISDDRRRAPERMVGKKIRELRLAQGRSLADIAKRADVSVATLSRVETGKQAIDLGFLLCVARILGASADEILDGRGSGNAATLAAAIASMPATDRAGLWRAVGEARRSRRGRVSRDRSNELARELEELHAHLELLREELDAIRARFVAQARRG